MKFVNEFNQFLATEVNLSQQRLDQLDELVSAVDRFLQTPVEFPGITSQLVHRRTKLSVVNNLCWKSNHPVSEVRPSAHRLKEPPGSQGERRCPVAGRLEGESKVDVTDRFVGRQVDALAEGGDSTRVVMGVRC